MGVVVAEVYLPVFRKLDVKSSYEYLEFRFHRYIRTFVSILFVLDEIMFLPMLVYVPSLAFEQVTGVNLHIVSWVVTAICVFYTFVGGIKAVVWTDTWQIFIMIISAIAIALFGTIAIGGFEEMWHRASEGGRLIFFNTDPSLTERQTIWSVLIGGFTFWTSYNAVNQTMVQRYMSLPTLRQSKKAVIMFAIGVSFFVTTCSYTGLVIYAAYWKCDPIISGLCKTDDQMLPAFVMHFLGHIPGISGLFIAAIFGAGLSSLSVILNSTAIVLLEDILKSLCKYQLSDRTAKIFAKSVILVLGIHTVLGVYIVRNLGGVLSVATSLNAIAAGTTFGLFSLGMLIPFANTKGAVAGGITSALFSGIISIGTQYFQSQGLVVPHTKLPVSIEGCSNSTFPIYPMYSEDEISVPIIFRLSYLWVSPIGFLTVMIVGSVVSLITRSKSDEYVNPDYLSPVIHRFIPKRMRDLGCEEDISS
ncbi:sodium-coupled monocarboxylate transporter 2 isoform X2 [Chrysoperla carnea]|nr:sodium-coupled monocarboxylate transporter 2 isoform X2 [Chrysoperla carnea]